MKFAELLAQLQAEQDSQEALAKALPKAGEDGDKKIEAAAAEGEEGKEGEENEEGETISADGEEGEGMAKSLTNEDGEVVIDATELLKSMQADIAEHGDVLAKALPQVLVLVQGQSKMLQQQGDLIKSLQTRVAELAGQGRGRKAVITVSEKPAETLVKSEPNGLTPQEFMLKANNAFEKGAITGLQLTALDVALREGKPVDQAVVAKVANS